MIVNIPLIIPDDSIFRIRKADGSLFGKGKIFKSKSSAHCAITYHSLAGATIEVLKPEPIVTYKYNPHGRAK